MYTALQLLIMPKYNTMLLLALYQLDRFLLQEEDLLTNAFYLAQDNQISYKKRKVWLIVESSILACI
jgi:hypothetical protein